MLYHRFISTFDRIEYRYSTTAPKEICDKYNLEFDNGNNIQGRPVHIDASIVENWYPKTFSQRLDYILLFINSCTPHMGQIIKWSLPETFSALFIDRLKNGDSNPFFHSEIPIDRSINDVEDEAEYMLECLKEGSYIEYEGRNDSVLIRLLSKGYERVDELQKNFSQSRDVFVAMQFGKETLGLREAIRKGIKSAGYNAIFIDEEEHNEFIPAKIFERIRECKFLVVDLSHNNGGAYIEEGYAIGLGKPVIQLCQKDTKLHFDIAQKNTIIWSTENEIPERLYNRIKATID